MNELPSDPSPPARLGSIAFGIAGSVLVHFGVGLIPVASGEPILLRWLRVLADHPVRAGIAATLLVVALRPRGVVALPPRGVGALHPRANPPSSSTAETSRRAAESAGTRSSH